MATLWRGAVRAASILAYPFADGEAVGECAGGVGARGEQEMASASWWQKVFHNGEIIRVIEDEQQYDADTVSLALNFLCYIRAKGNHAAMPAFEEALSL